MSRVFPMRAARDTSAAPSTRSSSASVAGVGDGNIVRAHEGLARERLRQDRAEPAGVALAGVEGGAGGLEGAVKHGGRAALVGAEVDVPAAQGESVLFAHDRAHDDVDRKGQVLDHPPDHGDLLRVLLPEVGPLRPEDVEELRHHGRDAAEVAGAPGALERRAHVLHRDPRLESRRVDVARRRSPDGVHAERSEEPEVGVERPRDRRRSPPPGRTGPG